jgi:hypothetical protein
LNGIFTFQSKATKVLQKYDEEIEGEKRKNFALGRNNLSYFGFAKGSCLMYVYDHCPKVAACPFLLLSQES